MRVQTLRRCLVHSRTEGPAYLTEAAYTLGELVDQPIVDGVLHHEAFEPDAVLAAVLEEAAHGNVARLCAFAVMTRV